MNMKKSLIAMAVAGVIAAPMAAQAGGYGRIVVAVTAPNEDADGQNADDLSVEDGSSYVGIKGEEDLGNGLNAIYDYQFDVFGDTGTLNAVGTRQSYVGLSGDFGTVKLGKSTEAYYEHVGVITDWGWLYATAPAYYNLGFSNATTNNFVTLFQGDMVNYSNSTGPLSFTAGAVADGSAGADNNEESIDKLYLGGTFDFGNGTVGIAHQSESNTAGPEPSAFGLSGTFSMGDLGFRGAYYALDNDVSGGNDPTGFDLMAHSSFGGGLSGHVGFSAIDADRASGAGDTTFLWGFINKALSDRTSVYAEFQSASVDGGNAADTDPTHLSAGVAHYF